MSSHEFRLRGGEKVLEYIRKFSSTEKVVFGIFAVAAVASAIMLAARAIDHFMVEVPAFGGELREGVIGLPRTINPVLAVTDVDRDISALVYSGLMRYSDGKIVTDIASSYSVSDDKLTYDFKIKPDVYFQDGMKLTADDVEFTVNKIQDPVLKSPRKADWANVIVKKISPFEIQFILKQPYSPFLANVALGIMPKHIWGNVSDDQFIFSQYNIEPIGAGPYKIESVTRDSGGVPTRYRLATWGKYHDIAPKITYVSFVFLADEGKALDALGGGSIDSLSSISPGEAARLASNSGEAYAVTKSPLPRVFGVFLNQNQAPVLADAVVRQALNISVDRQAIVSTALNNYGVPLEGPLPEMNGADRGASSDYNLADAKTLLEKNGWKKNSSGIYGKKTKTGTTTLAFDIYTADAPDLKSAANLVKQSWTNLGVKVAVKVFGAGDLYQDVIRSRKYDALLFGEQIGKDRDVYAFWHSSQRNAPGLNVALYANSKTDKLLEDIRATNDEATKSIKYAQFDRIIRNDIPAIFLYSPDFIYAVPKALRGLNINGITTPADRWNSIDSWYLKTEKVLKVFVK